MSKSGPLIIVEDDLDDQDFIRESFSQLNMTNEVRFYDNGKTAIDYLMTTREKPFIILCDINMPLMNGVEMRKVINETEYLRKKSIPFVFFTTSAPQSIVNHAYDMTVQGFFKKPNTMEAMAATLKLIVDYWLSCRHPNSDPET